MPSKIATTCILSYAFTFQEVGSFLAVLAKGGSRYFETNQEQLRYFCALLRMSKCFGAEHTTYPKKSSVIYGPDNEFYIDKGRPVLKPEVKKLGMRELSEVSYFCTRRLFNFRLAFRNFSLEKKDSIRWT